MALGCKCWASFPRDRTPSKRADGFRWVLWLGLTAFLTGPCLSQPASALTNAPVIGGTVVMTDDDAVARDTKEDRAAIMRGFPPTISLEPTSAAKEVLLRRDTVVMLAILERAGEDVEDLAVRLENRTINERIEQMQFAGSVIAFVPLTSTILASSPVLFTPPPWAGRPESFDAERKRQRIQGHLQSFGAVAKTRADAMGGRVQIAPVSGGVTGYSIAAGREKGIAPGTVVSVTADESPEGAECIVKSADDDSAALSCAVAPKLPATGMFLRSTGEGSARYQVRSVAITSKKATELLGTRLSDEQALLAFAASDALSAAGLAVAPPAGGSGERLAATGISRFRTHYGISGSQMDTYTAKFTAPEVQIAVVVDGYNSTMVEDVSRQVHKAWATVGDGEKRAEGTAVRTNPEAWVVNETDTVSVRAVMQSAVRCAVSRYLGRTSEDCE